MLDAREPPHGDFVAYVEKIEREQLARTEQPHKQAQLAGGKVDSAAGSPGETGPLSTMQTQRLLEPLQQAGAGAPGARGPLIGAAVGVALIAFGLIVEGGIILVLIGAALLWHNLRKLRRSAAAGSAGSAAQDVDRAFGHQAPRGKSEPNR